MNLGNDKRINYNVVNKGYNTVQVMNDMEM